MKIYKVPEDMYRVEFNHLRVDSEDRPYNAIDFPTMEGLQFYLRSENIDVRGSDDPFVVEESEAITPFTEEEIQEFKRTFNDPLLNGILQYVRQSEVHSFIGVYHIPCNTNHGE